MSFYTYKNRGNERCPGQADYESLHCITEKVCIQVNKVFDSCLQQEPLTCETIILDGISTETTYTFIKLRNTTATGTLSNLTITRIPDRCNFARVQADVTIPVQVTLNDVTNTEITVPATFTVHKDVVLYVPDASIIPYEIEAVVGAMGISGSVAVSGTTVILTADICVSIILKVVAVVELLVPSYGYCEIPPCDNFSDSTCDAFFSLPLFPETFSGGGCCCDE